MQIREIETTNQKKRFARFVEKKIKSHTDLIDLKDPCEIKKCAGLRAFSSSASSAVKK